MRIAPRGIRYMTPGDRPFGRQMGRNERCFCGSGRRYKHCHGSPDYEVSIVHALSKSKAEEVQRIAQQGLGNPIVSIQLGEQRLVAVKNRLLHSKGWKTFHDFLHDYIKMALGSDWGTAEINKPIEERHPLLVWYHKVCDFQRRNLNAPVGQVSTAPANGAMSVYLHLAYDLFALDHNAELQDVLLSRLRNRDKFWGARYEVQVAAIFIRAGFTIEFEDETDGSRTHCEFTATHRRTGKRFSVETKRREGKQGKPPSIVRLFNDALSKDADHDRVIFIDINLANPAREFSPYLVRAQSRLREVEIESSDKPPAYVFVTSTPWEHHLDEEPPPCTAIIEGFLIPDFKGGASAPSLRHAIEAREKHIEMHELMRSLEEHHTIPSTFDGEIPEFAFGLSDPQKRIKIGGRFDFPNEKGESRIGTITTATVMAEQKLAFCGVSFEDGPSGIYTIPLSDAEISAWRQHPETFFGQAEQKHRPLNTALDVYDFFHESCRRSTKQQLMEAMKGAQDIEQLRMLDQPTLASIRAERLAYGMMAQTRFFEKVGPPMPAGNTAYRAAER